MEFEFSEEQKMMKKAARDFLSREIAPIVNEYEKRGPFSKEEATKFTKMLLPLGYVVGPIPQEYGGLGLSLVSNGLLFEELSYAWPSLASMVHLTGVLPLSLTRVGTDEQRRRYLSRALSGDIISCAAISEPNVGSSAPSGIQTTAILDGNEYVINGTKTWVTNGPIADVADVLCVTDKSKGSLGLSRILVEKSQSPFAVKEIHKLGWRANPFAELSFADCRVPKENRREFDGATSRERLQRDLQFGRAMLGIRACGLAQAAIDASIAYAKERVQFGKPIGSFQMIQEMIVDMVINTESARLLALRALALLDKGVGCPKESSMAKALGCEMVIDVTSKAIQIHGAAGLDEELPIERYFRDARVFAIPDGTTQIQKLIVGRELLGIKAF
ncbi:MAG: acyl-CoA dehydrogenase [Chloroflexi bacterium]|nr:acyl-CoA dehydrogenase [Chloroflexota bacterium]